MDFPHLVAMFEVEARPATFATAQERSWKDAVAAAASAALAAAAARPSTDARFSLEIDFRMPPSRSVNERWDLDNLIKPTMDALGAVLGYRDWLGPAQVADDAVDRILASKRTISDAEAPGASIRVHASAVTRAEGRGPLWRRMEVRPRFAPHDLTQAQIPTTPGVYAWFRDDRPIYVGRAIAARGLRGRLAGNHLKTHADLSKSAFRRNVAEHLGIAPTSVTRTRPLTPEELGPVNAWVAGCEVAWIECASPAEGAALEEALKSEWKPPLTKR